MARPSLGKLERQLVERVLRGDVLALGPFAREFEAGIAALAHRRFGIACSSGTAGLHLAVRALSIGEGDEVITSPFSFVASANCILYERARPRFVDIEEETLGLDPGHVSAAASARTRAILPVHVFGRPCKIAEMVDIARHNGWRLIEDACEAVGSSTHGQPAGSFGDVSVFAFYPNKQITTGEGGMIVTDDDTFAATCRALRNQGREGMAWLAHERLGYNYRLSEINAALGVAQVQRLDEILEARRQVAHWYIERLMTNRYLILPTLDDETHMSWFVFVVRLNDLFEPGERDDVMRELRAEGIGCNNYFPPIHLQPYMMEVTGHKAGDFPVTEYVSARTLALPFFTRMTRKQVDRVCDVLEKTMEKTLMERKGRF